MSTSSHPAPMKHSAVTVDAPTPVFQLPKLPYAFDALAPAIDAKTMEIHHDKHHGAYVKNLNEALAGVPHIPADVWALCADLKTLVPADKQTAVRNNAGGHANHSLFWELLAPKGKGGEPSTALSKALNEELGGLQEFKEAFTKLAMARFGSGWAWLVVTRDGQLAVTSTANQDNPMMPFAEIQGTPILGLDVWEHAYYLNYQNKRVGYVAAFWDLVNWNTVNVRYAKVVG